MIWRIREEEAKQQRTLCTSMYLFISWKPDFERKHQHWIRFLCLFYHKLKRRFYYNLSLIFYICHTNGFIIRAMRIFFIKSIILCLDDGRAKELVESKQTKWIARHRNARCSSLEKLNMNLISCNLKEIIGPNGSYVYSE